MKHLYVDDTLVDLYPNTVIAQTLQVFDPGRIGSILTNFTANIKAPRTFRNDQTFGHLGNSKTKSDIPYSSLSCRYNENGIPIIQNARIVLNEVGEREFSFTIYSGPYGFFERIQDLTLWDLDTRDINSSWTQADRDGYRNAVTGIVQALVDDGRLVQDQVSSAPVIENQGGVIKPPQIYYHTVLEKIFDGFEYEGDIFTNDIYKKLVIPLSVIYNDPAFLEAKQFLAASPGTQIMVNPTALTNIIFNQNVKQGSDGFYDGTSEYIIVNTDTPDPYYRLFFYTNLTLIVTGGTVDIFIEATGYTSASELNKGSSTYSFTFNPTVGLKDGDVVRVRIIKNTGTPTVEIISGSFYSVSLTGMEGNEFLASIVGGYVYFNKLFEKITMLDFLKDFCVRFNVQITQINNRLIVNTLNHILDVRTGPDWTFKRDRGLDRIRYLFNSYGRTNYLKSAKDEFTPDLTDNYGDGSFTIPNENLRDSFTVFTSMFAVSEMINLFGVFMLNMNLEPNLANFARMPGKRLFFAREKYDFEPDVLYDVIERDDYLVGYFFDPDQDHELSFQYFIDNFHQKFIDRCLRKVRLLEREYNLSDLDIFAFNQQVPIWDNGERFLVTKIVNRVSRKVCKVELLKIESNPEFFFTAGGGNVLSGAIEDYLEIVSDDIAPFVLLEMELAETVTGNPTWECTFDNGPDTEVLTVIGDNSTDDNYMDHATSVDANVLKTDNDGFGTPTFPTATGYVEWLKNGVRVNTAIFDSSGPSSSFGLNYTFTSVVVGDTLTVKVFEDGSTP